MAANYSELLCTYEQSSNTPASRIALAGLSTHWHNEASQDDSRRINDATTQLDNFYRDNDTLYATANSTTGDTARQLGDLGRFVTTYSGELACGSVVDIGCGNGVRITVPMATMLPGCDVIGVDHRVPDLANVPSGLRFRVGDFSDLPLQDGSVRLATAHWSVLNDLVLRKQQLGALQELGRVLEPGGLFYFDVPSLEGRHGYSEIAEAYQAAHPGEPMGMLERSFPGGRRKKFYIYPKAELAALLDYSGFTVEQSEDWVTQSNQARRTVVARFAGS